VLVLRLPQSLRSLVKPTEIKRYWERVPQMEREKITLKRLINLTEIVQRVTGSVPFRDQWLIERGRCCVFWRRMRRLCSRARPAPTPTPLVLRNLWAAPGAPVGFTGGKCCAGRRRPAAGCGWAAILDKERTKEVQEYIDAAISKQEPLEKVLKLLSLFCLADDGFAPKQFDQYRRDILQVRRGGGGVGGRGGGLEWCGQAHMRVAVPAAAFIGGGRLWG
jgi:hypothetical protein